MTIPVQEFEAQAVAEQLGAGGVDNLVTNAERICTYQQQHIALVNQSELCGLRVEHHALLEEEQRLVELLRSAPLSGDLRRLRIRMVACSSVAVVLAVAGFAFTQLTLAPFRLGLVTWLISVGVAVLAPFLIDRVLSWNEVLVKVLTAVAAIGAIASGMLLAEIRGSLFVQQMQQNEAQAVVIDDATPEPAPENNFYQSSTATLTMAMLLLAFSMEIGAGIALHEAARSWPDTSEDWKARRNELAAIQLRLSQIARLAIMLRNEPEIFATRFWRDFYRSLLSNAARSAMTKLLLLVLAVSPLVVRQAHAEDRLNMVVAIDLTQSVATTGTDGKSEFQKNIDGVTRLLSQIPAGSRVTVIGITDHSFAQPYILLSAHVPSDAGYFGERLNAAQIQLVKAWKQRTARLDPRFPRTDILGALQLVSQMFAQQPDAGRKRLVIFSDMRQNTPELNLESTKIVPSFSSVRNRCGEIPSLHNIQVHVLGADGAGKSSAYWQSLQLFWKEYVRHAGAVLQAYSLLRSLPQD